MNKRWLWVGLGVLSVIVIGGLVLFFASAWFLEQTAPPAPSPAASTEVEPTVAPSDEETELATEPTTTPTTQPTATTTATATIELTSEQATATNKGPTLLKSADFVTVNSSYQGSGTASLFEQLDGSRQLRFEDFMVSSGPQLHVLLSADPMPTNHDELGDYLDLGPLQATSGQQDYEISADLDLGIYQSVVIYCVPFQVLFTVASFSS